MKITFFILIIILIEINLISFINQNIKLKNTNSKYYIKKNNTGIK